MTGKSEASKRECRRLTTRRWLADYGVAYDWAAVAGCKCLIVRGKVSAFASASTLTERRTIVSILCPCLPVCPLSSKPILSPFRPLSLEVSDAERASAAAGVHRRRRLIGVRFRRQAYTKPTNEDSRRVYFRLWRTSDRIDEKYGRTRNGSVAVSKDQKQRSWGRVITDSVWVKIASAFREIEKRGNLIPQQDEQTLRCQCKCDRKRESEGVRERDRFREIEIDRSIDGQRGREREGGKEGEGN